MPQMPGGGTAGRRVLTERQRGVLAALCDAIVPAVEGPDGDSAPIRAGAPTTPDGAAATADLAALLRRKGTDLGLPALIEEGLAETPEHLRAQVRQLLRIMGSPAANLLLAGRPQALDRMSPAAAEAYLRSWAQSRLALRRAGFNAMKQAITFLFYAAHPSGAPNPNWPAIGFPGPEATMPAAPSAPGPAAPAAEAPRETRPITPLAITADTRLDAEVCVIGSGAGGSVAAAVLSRAGRDVLLVERGGYYDRHDYTGDEYEMLQRLSLGKGLFSTHDNAFGLLASTCLGGSTVVNWCTSLRPPADVLEEWERAHGIDGLLGPEFAAALDAVCTRLNVNTAESQHNPNNQALADGARALGYRVETIPRNVRGCGDCGPCVYGCARGAKQDALATYVRDACGTGARVVVRCAAERLVARGDAVAAVEGTVTDPATGRRHRVEIRCKTVVLAGGAIFSPALLLRSGLGNGMVGRGIRLHPVTAALGLYPRRIEIWKGAAQTAVCTEFARISGTHGFWIEASPAHPGLAAMAVPWAGGEGHKRLMARLADTAALIVLVRDHGAGCVTLTSRGDPLVRYALHPEDRALMIRGLEEMAKIHLAAGALEVRSLHHRGICARRDEPDAAVRFARAVRGEGIRPGALALFSAHLMGGVPMGDDPRRAAVDPSGRLYGLRNVFVADASLFPSAPAVNPMITIMAMAHRVATRAATGV